MTTETTGEETNASTVRIEIDATTEMVGTQTGTVGETIEGGMTGIAAVTETTGDGDRGVGIDDTEMTATAPTAHVSLVKTRNPLRLPQHQQEKP